MHVTHRMSWAYCGIFFLAGSIILFEIAMTRVFAIMMWHHFTYMVISIALLGFGAAGSVLTARRDPLRADAPFKALSGYSVAYGVTAILAFFATTRVKINSLEIWSQKSNFFTLLLIYVLLSVPLVFGGLAVGVALSRLSERVNRLYFADLIGSAAGAAIATWILARFGNTTAVMTSGAIGLLGAFFFSLAAPPRWRIAPVALFVVALVLVAAFSGMLTRDAGGGRLVPALAWDIPYAPGKEFAKGNIYGLEVETRLPSATAEVAVSQNIRHLPGIGGEFGVRDRAEVDLRVAAQDGTAPTMLMRGAADIDRFPFLDDTQAASAYVCHRASGRTRPAVLVIGVGGGIDVMIALAHGATRVTGVEINRAMIEMATQQFADYTGGLLAPGGHASSDRIDLVHGEGRSYARRTADRFDVIQMSGVDTFTALSMGAYTLSESYLYTVEAVKELYEHLNEGGYVCYSRFILEYPKKPRETLRLANIAVTALDELGVKDPASNVCVFEGHNWASTMIKRGAFTPAEMRALDQFALDEHFVGIVFNPVSDPKKPFPPPRTAFWHALPELRTFVTGAVLPAAGGTPTDAERDLLAVRLWDVVVARAIGDAPGVDAAMNAFTEWFPEPARPRAREAVLGILEGAARFVNEATAGFHKTCSDFAVLLRGNPEEQRKFVRDYEYDVSPCRDDRPFFFNYYKYSGLFRGGNRAGQHWYHHDFPIGHLVLLASLLQILVLATILIVGPIWRLRRLGMRAPGKLRWLSYFGALGLGFMSIEIVMMQKMVLFLGHPTYALSVVLTALLAWTGIGSLLSERFRIGRRTFLGILVAIVVTTAGSLALANHALPLALGWPLSARILLAVAALGPLGVALGMAFPTGIRLVREKAPELIPWCWAINGFTSVLATIVCIMVALEAGFTVAMLLAALVYVGGFVAVLGLIRSPNAAASSSASAP